MWGHNKSDENAGKEGENAKAGENNEKISMRDIQ